MKNLFPEYHVKDETEIKEIWEKGIFIFDTNVLLNLYRYSDDTTNSLLNLMTRISVQCWLPYQIALEFNKNRYTVFEEIKRNYNSFKNDLNSLIDRIRSKNIPPFFTKEASDSFESLGKDFSNQIRDKFTHLENLPQQDSIFDRISKVFNTRITTKFTNEELQNIYSEGKKRYENKCPPGYKDIEKPEPERYGDLIIWKQIIALGKEHKKHIFFVTDEKKIDWWRIISDKILIGPRPELIFELNSEAQVSLHMLSSDDFLKNGKEFFKETVNQAAVEEIKAVANASVKNEFLKHYNFLKDIRSLTDVEKRENLNELQERLAAHDKYVEFYRQQLHDLEATAGTSSFLISNAMGILNRVETQRADLLDALRRSAKYVDSSEE